MYILCGMIPFLIYGHIYTWQMQIVLIISPPSLPPSFSVTVCIDVVELSKTTHLSDDLLPKGTALYDFAASSEQELSFKV